MDKREQRAEGRSSLGYKDLLRVGPGTIGGTYLRRFWHPVFVGRDLATGRAQSIQVNPRGTLTPEEIERLATMYQQNDEIAVKGS